LFSAKKNWFLSLQLFATVIILKKKRKDALAAFEATAENILTVQMTGGGQHL
jgi:hypothetical protein